MELDSHWIVAGFAGILILSYFFNIISDKLNIPGVFLLIITGFVIKYMIGESVIEQFNLVPVLEVVGIVGLIMIVLEAAIDLQLKKENLPLIGKSFIVALGIMVLTVFYIAMVFSYFLDMDLYIALIYAIPLSIMSSAVIIPSVSKLLPEKREFMIYEATFSDILGIMFFYFFIDSSELDGFKQITFNIVSKIVLTIIVAIVISYLMVFLFQKIKTPIKYMLMVAVLLLIYASAKLMHLSSLLIVLFFGLVLNNYQIFFIGKLKNWLNHETHEEILSMFKTIITEASFVVRTFFFILFGMYISVDQLGDPMVLLISSFILAALYGIRYLNLRFFLHSSVFPELLLAPRGLITILLFFAIPVNLQSTHFDPAILLIVIIASSVIMMGGLMSMKDKDVIKYDRVEAGIHANNPEFGTHDADSNSFNIENNDDDKKV